MLMLIKYGLFQVVARVRKMLRRVVCAGCGELMDPDDCRVTCTCASAEVKERLGGCGGVYFCPGCWEGLRRPDGTLPWEWDERNDGDREPQPAHAPVEETTAHRSS